jgi:hypothetical protein
MTRFRSLPLYLITSLLLFGCAARVKNVTNLPPGVTLKEVQDWDAAVADLHKIAVTVSKAHQVLAELHEYGAATDDYYVEAIRVIGHIDQLEISAETVLRNAPQHFGAGTRLQVQSYINQVATELQHLNSLGATGIKNPKSQDKVNQLLRECTAIVGLVLSLTTS